MIQREKGGYRGRGRDQSEHAEERAIETTEIKEDIDRKCSYEKSTRWKWNLGKGSTEKSNKYNDRADRSSEVFTRN